MKQKTLILEEYQPDMQKEVGMLLERLVTEEETSVMVVLKYFRISPDKENLLSFAEMMKAVGRKKEFTVDVILETNHWKRVRRLRKTLNRFSIRIRLWVTKDLKPAELVKQRERMLLDTLVIPCQDYGQFYEAYERWKQVGLTLCPEPYRLNGEAFLKFFSEWIQDPKAVWPESLEDMATSLLTGLPSSDCWYSSCLGNYLYLDAEGCVYFCREKRQEACLGRAEELSEQLFEQDSYQKALEGAIHRRRNCVENCRIYSFCKGGCPLEEQADRRCQEQHRQLDAIREVLEKELPTAFENMENRCLRKLCLSLVAYGFRFSFSGDI